MDEKTGKRLVVAIWVLIVTLWLCTFSMSGSISLAAAQIAKAMTH